MMHKPIQFKNLCLSFPHKICFEDFSAEISFASRIAIIGRNGSGKSTLLKMLHGSFLATAGEIKIPPEVQIGYVPQIIENFASSSGGERLHAALTEALCANPNVLLLDEPTNHLDRRHRKSLLRMLDNYSGTLIIVSHDVELLRKHMHCFWHIDQGKVQTFSGDYDDYRRDIQQQRDTITREIALLEQQQKGMHQALMQEQHRAAKSRKKGAKSIQQRKWPTIVSHAKAVRAEATSGRKKAQISVKRQQLNEQLSQLHLPKIIKPTFSLTAGDLGHQDLITITDGQVGYAANTPLLDAINLSLAPGSRLAIIGNNGSGKTTLIKAILNAPEVVRDGIWLTPKAEDIGYLDQHYATLPANHTVLAALQTRVPDWPEFDCRRHLCDFLFCSNEEVHAAIHKLSGGEKARLSLALIAAKTPKLLILDEVTNNLDLATHEHVIQVLQAFPGSLIIISHDENFLQSIGVIERYYPRATPL